MECFDRRPFSFNGKVAPVKVTPDRWRPTGLEWRQRNDPHEQTAVMKPQKN